MKSNMSLLASAVVMSLLCSVRRLLSSAWVWERISQLGDEDVAALNIDVVQMDEDGPNVSQ